MNTETLLDKLIERYPVLASVREDIEKTANMIIESYENGGQLLACGNGGSSADADHIVGELMKSFSKKRPLESSFETSLASTMV